MSTVVTEFQRSLDDIRQEGQATVLVQQILRKFGQETAEEVQRSILERPSRDRIALVATAILDCARARSSWSACGSAGCRIGHRSS